MGETKNNEKERSFVLVGPDGRMLLLAEEYKDPHQWDTLETDSAVLMVAKPKTLKKKQALLEKITAYVDEHLGERITLRQVAEHCNVSVSTITQMFQKKTDVTFHGYLTRRRITMAQQLIRQGLSLEEVQKQVGYGDYSSFYRAFRQVCGISPRNYKKQAERER